jgi:hypothetical protein
MDMKGTGLGMVTYVGSASSTHQEVAHAPIHFAARHDAWQDAAQGEARRHQGTNKHSQLHLGCLNSRFFGFLTVDDITEDGDSQKTAAAELAPFLHAIVPGRDMK